MKTWRSGEWVEFFLGLALLLLLGAYAFGIVWEVTHP
jgi:hypothetical protein